jgi:hypothetical protein
MNKSLKEYKKIISIREYTVKEGREYLNIFSHMLLGAEEKIKHEIVNLILYLINDKDNFSYFPFGELVYFFEYDFDEFNEVDKEKIIIIVTENFEDICDSENDMIPFILMDFIARYCKEEDAIAFIVNILNQSKKLSLNEKKYLGISVRILNHKGIKIPEDITLAIGIV